MNEAPDYFEPFEAWRVWKVVREGRTFRLGSVIQKTLWPTGEALTAECLRARHRLRRVFGRHGHVAPQPPCECGVYAAPLEHIGQYLVPAPCNGVARVLGRVALWGTVIECERGYRASHAYPIRIYVPADAGDPWRLAWDEIAVGLGHYRVPVELLPSRASEASQLLLAECQVARARP